MKFIIKSFDFFFFELEKKFNCKLETLDFDETKIIVQVENLNNKDFIDIMFAFKQKLETTVETVGMYIKAL